jgi:hypothetical protein
MLIFRCGKRVDLIGKDQHRLPFFDAIGHAVDQDLHHATGRQDKFKTRVHMRGEAEIDTLLHGEMVSRREVI